MTDRPSASEAEAYIRSRLPLAATMDVRVASLGLRRPARARARTHRAPGGERQPPRHRLRGGSIATLAILAGWTAVHFRLRADGVTAQTVVQRTSMEYGAPAHSDLTATVSPIDERSWARLRRGIDRHGRGRTRVCVDVRAGDRTVAHFQGSYVALDGAAEGR